MPKGNPKGYLNLPGHEIQLTGEENANMVGLALDIFNAKEPDLHKPEEVEAAISEYFNNCIRRELRPGNLGLYAMLGIDKKEAERLVKGLLPGKASPASVSLLKRAMKTISSFRETLGSQGKLNPATLIFWQKNFDGLEDQQTITVEASANDANLTPEQIAKQIEEDIPIDADYTEKPI